MRFASFCGGIGWNGMNDIFGTDATALRLGKFIDPNPQPRSQGSRSGKPGLEGEAALRLKS